MARLSLPTVLAVALGGVLGGGLRLVLMTAIPLEQDPLANGLALTQEFLTLTLINLTGSFALGWVSGVAPHSGWPDWARVGVSTGVLGSFTTLSALTTAWLAALVVLGNAGDSTTGTLVTAGVLGLIVLLGTAVVGALVAALGIRTASLGRGGS
ncbi:MAG: FluC/FEX family fluoride channel [Micrococcaceae bacterium]